MQAVKQVTLTFDKSEREHAPWHIANVPLGYESTPMMVVGFKSHDWAANHRHADKEALVCIAGELYLSWREVDGVRQELKMIAAEAGASSTTIFIIESHVPHLIENRSSQPAVMCVWSEVLDDHDTEVVDLADQESLLG